MASASCPLGVVCVACVVSCSTYVELDGVGHIFWQMAPESLDIIGKFVATRDEVTPVSKL